MTLKIGDILEVKALAVPDYYKDENTKDIVRYVVKDRLDFPQRAWYVGYTIKFIGKIDPGGLIRTSTWEPPDEEPPRLVPEGSHKVYRIRFHERGKEHHCFPEDVIKRSNV